MCTGNLRAQSAFATVDSAEVYQANLCASDAATGLSLDIGGLAEVCGSHPAIDEDAAIAQTASSLWFACKAACASGNDWTCVGHANWPPPKAPTCTIGLRITDYVALGPVGGALVQACSPDDVNCRGALAHGTTDADGWLHLPVPNAAGSLGTEGLNGFARISGPDLVTTDWYWGFPLVEGSYPVALLEMSTTAEYQQVLKNVQVTPIAGRGELSVFVLDCLIQPAPGVMVTLSPPGDESTKGFSTQGVATNVTDATGIIFFVNVPAGFTTITATPSGLQGPAAEAHVNVQADASTIATIFGKTPGP